ncbi:hypothetical protein PAPYR_11593 [Paratrimastix pyriformis]|uniref:Uncharacterized protein n=1 Tax=Paratrimastix pyriformis TaxID=342808 RepID=A0ABQ8U3G5_9EUKA|nr:hypothetical protein PAPYR_11593 [Paratrimastix pyriformis]
MAHGLPAELLWEIIDKCDAPSAQTYCDFLELSHDIRARILGTAKRLSFSRQEKEEGVGRLIPDRQSQTLTTENLSCLIGPCIHLEDVYLPWVQSTFAHHTSLRALHAPSNGLHGGILCRILELTTGLVSLSLEADPNLTTSAVIATLGRHCPRLESLTLEVPESGAVDFGPLSACPLLRRLCVYAITGAAGLADVLPRLPGLNIYQFYGPTTGLPAGLPQVTHLAAPDLISVPTHLCALEELTMTVTPATAGPLEALLAQNAPTLRRVCLQVRPAAGLSPAGFAALRGLPRLEELDIEEPQPAKALDLIPTLRSFRAGGLPTGAYSPGGTVIRSGVLATLRLSASEYRGGPMTLDTPALQVLELPLRAERVRAPILILNCPALRHLRGLTACANVTVRSSMPCLETLGGAELDEEPRWLGAMLAHAPRLQTLESIRLATAPAYEAVLGGTQAPCLTRFDMVTFSPARPLGLPPVYPKCPLRTVVQSRVNSVQILPAMAGGLCPRLEWFSVEMDVEAEPMVRVTSPALTTLELDFAIWAQFTEVLTIQAPRLTALRIVRHRLPSQLVLHCPRLTCLLLPGLPQPCALSLQLTAGVPLTHLRLPDCTRLGQVGLQTLLAGVAATLKELRLTLSESAESWFDPLAAQLAAMPHLVRLSMTIAWAKANIPWVLHSASWKCLPAGTLSSSALAVLPCWKSWKWLIARCFKSCSSPRLSVRICRGQWEMSLTVCSSDTPGLRFCRALAAVKPLLARL